MRPIRPVVVSLALLCAALGPATPARASSFPGANGEFAFYAGGGVIKTANPDGTGVTKLLRSGGGTDEAWSPDGRQLAFVTVGIAVVNQDGTGLHQITTNVTDGEPTWSQDGKRVAFWRQTNGGGPNQDLMVATARGGGVTDLTPSTTDFGVTDPKWSPLGDEIAFVADFDSLMTINPDTHSLATVISPTFDVREISWSPDGQSIAFVHGPGEIWVVGANGSNPHKLFGSSQSQVSDIAWSPDGTEIGFICRWGGVDQISVMGSDGSNPHSLGVNTTAYFDWQPQPRADLSVSKAEDAVSYTVGDEITYTMSVTNNGPDPAFGVALADPLPLGTALVSAHSSQGGCTGATTVTCAIGWVPASGSVTVTVTVTANAAGKVSNRATVSEANLTPDQVPGNNSSTAIAKVVCPPAFVTKWGTLGSGPGDLNYPSGVAIDGAGNVHVVDSNNDRVEKFTASGSFLKAWGGPGTSDGKFDSPGGISAVGDSTVADTNNNRIEVFSYGGTFIRKWGTPGNADGEFAGPSAVAVDSSGFVYVADTGNNRIQKFVLFDGSFVTKWGSKGTANGDFDGPSGVAVDDAGHVYVADSNNDRVEKFSSTGNFLTAWGQPGSGEGDFNTPFGVAVDTSGHVYVADANNNRIQEFTGSGAFLTAWGSSGTGDGEFDGPTALAVDGSGDVYVADSFNNRIQEFAPCPSPEITGFSPSWGPVGTSVTITGTDLGGANGVGFNGTPATTFSVVSPTEVTAKVPPGATTGPISVSAPGGIATSSSSFAVGTYKADAKIKLASDVSYIGNNVYNTTGAGQTRTVSARPGTTKTFDLEVENDGTLDDGFRLKSLGSARSFHVEFLAGLSGSTVITAAVVNGTYTLHVPFGGAEHIRMQITPDPTAPIGASLARLVTATSTHAGSVKDAVKGVENVVS